MDTKRRIICNNCGNAYETYEENMPRCPICRSDLFYVQHEVFNYIAECFRNHIRLILGKS